MPRSVIEPSGCIRIDAGTTLVPVPVAPKTAGISLNERLSEVHSTPDLSSFPDTLTVPVALSFAEACAPLTDSERDSPD